MPNGIHILQVEGFVSGAQQQHPAVQVLSIHMRVNVLGSAGKQVAQPASKPQAKPSSKQVARQQRIQFEPYSAQLTKAAKQQLHVAVEQLSNKTRNVVRIVGFVSAGGSASHARQLGNARSQSVERYLKSQGVQGTYVLKLGGSTVKNSQFAPHARVTIYPNR
jgi:outer membrane protein OmpA-like peptidoglycan-associated protein